VPLTWRGIASWRFLQLQAGLLCYGLAVALVLDARIGLDPWSCFHQGVSLRTGLSFGRVTQLLGLLIIAGSWLFLRERPGVGTVFNMLMIGPWVDLFRGQAWFPVQSVFLPGLAQFLAGLLTLGLASGLYLSARAGAGPRDGLLLGIARRTGMSIRRTRVTLEILLLGTGWLLGGPVGMGTIVFALLMGPLMQQSLAVFRFAAPPGAEPPLNGGDG